MAYDVRHASVPKLSGSLLRLIVNLAESPLSRWAVLPGMLKGFGIQSLRALDLTEPPTALPVHPPADPISLASAVGGAASSPSNIARFANAYRGGHATPEQVAARFLQAVARLDSGPKPLRAFIAIDPDDLIMQARASTARHRAGLPLSIFDGVPVAVKDELSQIPYPTTVGTSFLGDEPAHVDGTVVSRLRTAGALLVGKTNMHEVGIGVTGNNPHHGVARNPYHLAHHTGGSSSGSAAAVAAGLCAVAVGADGGGSIRIPAALCGVVGLKPTFGRISTHGAFSLCQSVGHIGPLAATVEDATLLYELIAGPDSADPITLNQPQRHSARPLDLESLRIGVYWDWFRDAETPVVDLCQSILATLKLRAELIPIEIPELEAMRVAHAAGITTEMSRALQKHLQHGRDRFGHDARLSLAMAQSLTDADYERSQRMRTRAIAHFMTILDNVDFIVTPATARTAPPIPESKLPSGIVDLALLGDLMRFATPANLTGLPAISIPIGYDRGLPVGIQFMAKPWQEHVLLGLAQSIEPLVEHKPPAVHVNLLAD